MIIKHMQEHGEFESYELAGTVLSIGEHVIDIDEAQKEDQVIIDLMGGERFVANVIIPPARFEEGEPESDGETPPPSKLPVDMDAVVLILWAKPTKEGE